MANNPARIDKTRAVSFHCPSLASGTYSTTGQMGGSQLAMVPITVGVLNSLGPIDRAWWDTPLLPSGKRMFFGWTSKNFYSAD